MKKRSLISLVIMLLVMACTPSVPSEYIQPGEMEDILYDYHIGQAIAKSENRVEMRDFEKTKYFLAVLHKHGVKQADFDSSMVYYYSHLPQLKSIYTEVNQKIADEAKELGATVGAINRYSQYSTTGDTANIWKGATDLMLMPRPTMNRYDFTVKVDSSFYTGDSFMFQFMSEYIWQSGMKDMVVCLIAKYEGDSIIQTASHISVSGLSQIRIPANKENRLKEMRGYIYLGKGNGEDDNARKMLFINQIQLIRFHNKEEKKDDASGTKNDESTNDTKPNHDKTDSMQRGDNARRPVPDATRIRNLRRLRDELSTAPSRTSKH